VPIAKFVLLCVLSAAKSFPFFAVHSELREWPTNRPPADKLEGSRALILGYGEIGRGVGDPCSHRRYAALFLDNLKRFQAGQPLANLVDYTAGD
jgi:phosphoglycerate dehydrogenase-like enzyme